MTRIRIWGAMDFTRRITSRIPGPGIDTSSRSMFTEDCDSCSNKPSASSASPTICYVWAVREHVFQPVTHNRVVVGNEKANHDSRSLVSGCNGTRMCTASRRPANGTPGQCPRCSLPAPACQSGRANPWWRPYLPQADSVVVHVYLERTLCDAAPHLSGRCVRMTGDIRQCLLTIRNTVVSR